MAENRGDEFCLSLTRSTAIPRAANTRDDQPSRHDDQVGTACDFFRAISQRRDETASWPPKSPLRKRRRNPPRKAKSNLWVTASAQRRPQGRRFFWPERHNARHRANAFRRPFDLRLAANLTASWPRLPAPLPPDSKPQNFQMTAPKKFRLARPSSDTTLCDMNYPTPCWFFTD